MFASVAIEHVCANSQPDGDPHVIGTQEVISDSFAQQRVAADGVVRRLIKPQLKVHFEASNISFVVPGERYRWSKLMTDMVESTDEIVLKNSILPIAINNSDILNHSHAINAMMSFLSLEDMDLYLNMDHFVEKINEDNGVKLDLSTIYTNNRTIEVL